MENHGGHCSRVASGQRGLVPDRLRTRYGYYVADRPKSFEASVGEVESSLSLATSMRAYGLLGCLGATCPNWSSDPDAVWRASNRLVGISIPSLSQSQRTRNYIHFVTAYLPLDRLLKLSQNTKCRRPWFSSKLSREDFFGGGEHGSKDRRREAFKDSLISLSRRKRLRTTLSESHLLSSFQYDYEQWRGRAN